MSRTYHTPKQEAKKSQRDLEALEAEREGIQARDEALRDRAFGKEKD